MEKRCTFAIISHPDAGKTTVTEKIIWFGGLVRKIGMVKSKTGNFAKSDWMKMEQERGISVSSSVMSFSYQDRSMHLLDTPGHKDFSEDTYRTLTAVESVLMMIDSAKGVEEQTIKLMEVCRLRDTPIVTFMNKFDRDALDPFELLDNLEKILSIQCVPLTWPIGDGINFRGVYDLRDKTIRSFKDAKDPNTPVIIEANNLDDPKVMSFCGENLVIKLKEDLRMIEDLIPPLDKKEYLAGIQTPVFFGSALHNFGVKEVLDYFAKNAPGPASRKVLLPPFLEDSENRIIEPEDEKFSGFIFKIQANMDKNHRDRMAFLRVCSGKFCRNQKLFHVRTKKEIKITSPMLFQAQERMLAEEAWPGDIIGLHDTGKFQIGDTFTEGEEIQFTGIPSFAPEIFKKVILKDPIKRKQLDKGLEQLSEEGTVQLFYRKNSNEKILGSVGQLQFEVVRDRLEDEYGVRGDYEHFPLIGIRWPKFPDQKVKNEFISNNMGLIFLDSKNRVCLGVKSDWELKMIKEKNPKVEFFKNSEYR